MLGPPRLFLSRLGPSARMATSCSVTGLARWLMFLLHRRASTDMPSATLWELISSTGRSSKKMFLRPIIVMFPMLSLPTISSLTSLKMVFVSLLADNGHTKDDLKLPDDYTLLKQF